MSKNFKALEFSTIINNTLHERGLLLASIGEEGSANVMTIGWGHIGVLWRKPFFIAYIRHSRYSHSLIEQVGDFTVNVPPNDFENVLEFCGTKSGRYVDKIKELGLKTKRSTNVRSPSLSECLINLECKVVFKKEIEEKDVPLNDRSKFYPNDDYHTCYFAEIVGFDLRDTR
ncbi:MAG: flavin reductase family protein [Nitrososphaeria archaeon]